MADDKTIKNEQDGEVTALTVNDLKEFLAATDDEQWEILLAHAQKNRDAILKRKTQEQQIDEKRND